MTNKSYAITMSLLRIGLLGGQIAVGPSAAAQPALAAASQQPARMDWEGGSRSRSAPARRSWGARLRSMSLESPATYL
jgi:hypothetical protein